MVALVLLLVFVSGAVAQFPAKQYFGQQPARVRLHAQSSVQLPAHLDAERLARLRQLAQTTVSLRVLPHGAWAVSADRRALPPLKAATLQDASAAARQMVEQTLQQVGITAPELAVDRSWRDELGTTHVVLHQRIAGIPIWSTQLLVHYNAAGVLVALDGTCYPTDLLPSLRDAIGPEGAQLRAREYLAAHTANAHLWAAERVIFPERTPPWRLRSCWHVTAYPDGLQRWEVFVDTESGQIVFAYNNTHRDGPATAQAQDLLGQQRTLHTYQIGGTYYLLDVSRPMFNAAASRLPDNPIGAILTVTANNTDLQNISHITSPTNTWSNPTSVSAHVNAGVAYEYYRTTHGRNSLDGSGGTIVSVIHVTQNGRPMDNAFWNGKVMAYGDGYIAFRPLARGLDVAAHEMTHGVIEHTANLVYLSQSGAINESMADAFAMMVDRDDWLVGEDVVNPAMFPSGAMRSFVDPHNGGTGPSSTGWQPKHMNEYQTLPETEEGDNGGVHVNSGIPNHACYLLAQQIGREKTERIYYRALTTYLTQNSQFLDLRRAIIRAAEDIFGSGAEAQAAAAAFDAVGITDGGSGGTGPHDYEPVPGSDRLLVYSPNVGALFAFDDGNNPISPRQVSSASGLFSRPSITDDGTLCFYVAADNTLRACMLSATMQEQVIDPNPVWRSVAISPDGQRLAATSIAYDPMVWVFDLSASQVQSRAFRLYTPNYSGDTSSSQLAFADALQWNLDGETLLLDALNATPTGTGDTLVYWDILQLRAWNRSAGTFGSGIVVRVLPVQPPGINIGNPTYAKNSPYVIAFDQYDENSDQYSLMAANLLTQQVERLSTTDGISFPSYRGDDARIAFTTYGMTTPQLGIATIGLDASKIRATGSPQALLANAVMPLYYRVGQRPTSSVEASAEALSAIVEPNPITADAATLAVYPAPPQWSWTLSDALGQCLAHGTSSTNRTALPLDGFPSGIYYCTISASIHRITIPLLIVR